MKDTKEIFLSYGITSLVVLLSLSGVISCYNGNNNPAINVQGTKHYSIKESGTYISYDVGGTVDESFFLWPSMPSTQRFVSSVMIRNTGDNEIVNPRVSINGFRIPLTTAELLSSITLDSQDSLDRLLKIFYSIDRYSVHNDMSLGKWQDSPLTFFVGYGAGMCEDRANIQRMLWDVLGHKSRGSWADNHTAFEVEDGGRVLHFDPDTQAYYLVHDNSTVASSQDIRDDPMLVQRAVHYRNYVKYPISATDPEPNMWYSSEKIAALYSIENHNILSSDAPVHEKFNILLRPGEGYGWNSDKPKHLHPLFQDSSLSDVIRDFTWETRLDFSKASHLWAIRQADASGNPARDGVVTIDRNTAILLSYGHPFPMTGARITLLPGGNVSSDTLIRLTITGGSYGQKEILDIPLNELISGNDSLSSCIQKFDYPVHNLQIEITNTADNTSISLKGLSIELYSQATAYAFRSLKTGRNDLVYSDASEQRSVEVQVNAIPLNVTLPGFSAGTSFAPSDNNVVAEGDLAFSWPKSDGADVKGYQIQISAFADMRYPLSPTFERMIERNDVIESRGSIQYKLPWRGMLPVNRNLYWRVRPYRENLLAGRWSSIFPLVVKGPQAPEKIKIEYDQGKVILSWSASPSGTRPLYFEIHTSSLEGFVPMSEPHRILGFGDQTQPKYTWLDVTAADWPVVPETTLTTTNDTSIILYDGANSNPAWFGRLGAHFRVIAIDADGSRSCPSPQTRLLSPLVLPGRVVSTVGRITTMHPYFLGLWNKPVL